jgi:membrane-bound ClpP family serine protease
MDIVNESIDKTPSARVKTGSILIHIGRFIAFIAAAFIIVMLVNDGALKDVSTRDMAGLLLLVFAVIALGAYILSYWKVNYAGMLLIAVSLAFAIHSFYYLNNGQIALWLLTGMPQLVAGGLLLLGWRMKKDNKLR